MSIDKNAVARIARLARIRVEDAEQEALAGELSKIIGLAEELAAVDTEGVAPLTSVVQMNLALREDKVTDGDLQEDILRNAPDKQAGFFVVPKVVE